MLVPSDKRPTTQDVLEHKWISTYATKKVVTQLPSIVTKNLRSFHGAQKVKKAFLTYLATQLSEKELGPMKKLFLALDKNGDGRLSADEIRQGLAGQTHDAGLFDIIASMDTDGSGYIDYNGKYRVHIFQNSLLQLQAKRCT